MFDLIRLMIFSAIANFMNSDFCFTNAVTDVPKATFRVNRQISSMSYDCALSDSCQPLTAPSSKIAFVTLIVGSSDSGYVKGALALSSSLSAVKSTVRRLCMVSPDVSEMDRQILAQGGFEIIPVSVMACNASRTITAIRNSVKYNNYCTKLRAWTLTNFDKLVFLDADALVLRNIDHLFQLNSSLAMAPDSGCPEHANTGVLVIEPSMTTFNQLVKMNENSNSFDATDQGLINSYCASIGMPWYFSGRNDPTCTRLPTAYNLNLDYTVDYVHLQFGARPTVQPMALPRVIQFAGARVQKPWTALAKAMALYSEQADGAQGGYLKPDYIPNEWWSYYVFWVHALVGDIDTYTQLVQRDIFDGVLESNTAFDAEEPNQKSKIATMVLDEDDKTPKGDDKENIDDEEDISDEDDNDDEEEWDDPQWE